MEFHGKLSVGNLPWKFHVSKNVKTPWRLRGIPCGIFRGITMEHDVLHGNSVEFSYGFAQVELPLKTFRGITPRRPVVFLGNSMEYSR